MDGAAGGYVNVIAPATSRMQFEKLVRNSLEVWNLRSVEFKDVEQLVERLKRGEVPNLLISLAEQSEADGRVRCGEVYLYADDE